MVKTVERKDGQSENLSVKGVVCDWCNFVPKGADVEVRRCCVYVVRVHGWFVLSTSMLLLNMLTLMDGSSVMDDDKDRCQV